MRARMRTAAVAATFAVIGGAAVYAVTSEDDGPVAYDTMYAESPAYDGGWAPEMDVRTSSAPVAAEERAVVRSAWIEVAVDDTADAVGRIGTMATDAGGYVAGSSLARDEDGAVTGTLTLRVPAERLEMLVAAIDDLARYVPSRSTDGYDVTVQLSDLDAELTNLRAFEVELRALLQEVRVRGGDVSDLLEVSDRLRIVRSEIDRLEARQTDLVGRVELATVTVTVSQARAALPVGGGWDVPGEVRDAAAALVALARTLVTAAIWALVVGGPIVGTAGAVVAVTLARRRRKGWRRP